MLLSGEPGSASRACSPHWKNAWPANRTPACGISARRCTRTARCIRSSRAGSRRPASRAAIRPRSVCASWRLLSRRPAVPPEDVALIAAMLSVPTGDRYRQLELNPQRRKERTFGALLRRLERLARSHPVLMLFEDAQWADPSSLELLDALIDRLAELPILLVISFRADFTAPWVGRADASLIALSRLNRRRLRDAGRAGERGARAHARGCWNGSSRRPMACRCSSRN